MSPRLAAAAVALFSCANALRPCPATPASKRPPASSLEDYFALRLSYFQPGLSTEGRLDSDTGTSGTMFSGEDDSASTTRRTRVAWNWRSGCASVTCCASTISS